jgi:2-desacetyl-2-hydroxyethyl bacteriochlorophyllide A dehydrogenase
VKAALLDHASSVRVVKVPQPSVGDHDVLIQVGACGICASDLHLAQIKGSDLPYPLVPGHEVAGTVVRAGQGVTNVRVGEHVVVQPAIACGICRLCQQGCPNLCLDAQIVGVHRPGGFAEYLAVPAQNAHSTGALPDGIAACTEPLACALHGLVRLAPRPADRVLITGAGTIGLFFLQLMRQQCTGPITVVDLHPHRLEMARRLGADQVVLADGCEEEMLTEQHPRGFDCVVDATGVPSAIEAAFRYLAPASKLLLLGSPPTAATISIHPRRVQRYDVTVAGAYSFSHEFTAALQLLQGGRVQAGPIVTHQYPLQAFPEAWEQARSGQESIKVQIVPV